MTALRNSGSFHFCFRRRLSSLRELSAMGMPLFQAGMPLGRPGPRRAGAAPAPACCSCSGREGAQGVRGNGANDMHSWLQHGGGAALQRHEEHAAPWRLPPAADAPAPGVQPPGAGWRPAR